MNVVLKVDQLIEKLSTKGLVIDDLSRLKYFIKNFNYNSVISGYSSPFMDLTSDTYEADASSNQIIELYNYDHALALLVLEAILYIEKKINTNVAYGIITLFDLHDGCLLKVNKNLINNTIFNNIHELETKMSVNYLIVRMLKYCGVNSNSSRYEVRKTKNLFKKWENCPLDIMCLSWSFSTTLYALFAVNNNVRFKIIEKFQLTKTDWEGFSLVLKNVMFLRNLISHSDVTFSCVLPYQHVSIYKLYKKLFNVEIAQLSVYNLIEFINFFSSSPNNLLLKNVNEAFDKLKIKRIFKDKIMLHIGKNNVKNII